MQVIAFLITYFSDDLRNTYMLQVFLRYFASYIRVHFNDISYGFYVVLTSEISLYVAYSKEANFVQSCDSYILRVDYQ